MLAVARPSLRLRALVALTLLAGFYGLTFTIALALLACAVGVVVVVIARETFNYGMLLVFVMTLLPAIMLVVAVLRARPPKVEPRGHPLTREEAPRLYAILDEIAKAAKTRAVQQVYLAPIPIAGVSQVGGTFGMGSKRVLVLGVPTMATLRVGELRSVLAHEYGHFVGSDTALAGIDGYTRALFVSVLKTTAVHPFHGSQIFVIAAGEQLAQAIGGAIARFYARLYMRITHAMSRRQELAADALSAELVGSAVAASALESATVVDPLYRAYLFGDVRDAVDAGAIPTDVVEGFASFRAKVEASEHGRALLARIRAEQTDPFDTHPSLAERLAAFAAHPSEARPRAGDEELATSLLDLDWRHWLSASTSALFEREIVDGTALPPLERMPWADVPARAYVPRATRAADGARRALARFADASTSVEMLAKVIEALETGGLVTVATHVEPRLRGAAPADLHQNAQNIVAKTLIALVTGALIERGARATVSFGEPTLVWTYENEDVRPVELVLHAFNDASGRAALREWSSRLARAEA